MRRFLLLCAAVAAIVWLEFAFYPGHTYLRGETQIYVPVIERLANPGFLSRDLVATHPYVTYTIYDELTLFLHQGIGLDLQTALSAQQVLCRAAAVSGVFLIASGAGLTDVFALLAAALLNLGAVLAGPAVSMIDPDPIPRAFAFSLVLLAVGLLAKERPLLSSICGGIALIYDARIAALFWIVILFAIAFDRELRSLFKATLPALLVFALLLANFAQLQPGQSDRQISFGKIPDWLASLQRFRTDYVWVSTWAATYIWQYAAIFVLGLWATARVWPALNRQTRWFFLALPAAGLLSVPVSYIGVEWLRRFAVAQIQPAQNLLFTIAIASIACAIAGIRAARAQRIREGALWLVVVFAMAIDSSVFDFFRPRSLREAAAVALCLALACGLAALASRFGESRWRAAPFIALIAAVFAIPAVLPRQPAVEMRPLAGVVNWAVANTWGSSLFLFPDAGRSTEPGIFRARSRRGLWVDWEGGVLVDYFEGAGAEWAQRWRQTAGRFTPVRIQQLLPLEIDYYVLKRKNSLANIPPVFQNSRYVVYDAHDLRNATEPLRLAASP
jgi:hypothetical protein